MNAPMTPAPPATQPVPIPISEAEQYWADECASHQNDETDYRAERELKQ